MALSTDFAFEGFRIIRERPLLIFYWGIVSLIVMGVGQTLLLQHFAPLIDQMNAISQSPEAGSDPMAVFGLLGKLVPFYLIVIGAGLVFQAVMSCAVYRAVDGQKPVGFGHIQFGMAEVWQIIVTIVFYLLFFVFYIGLLIAAAVIGGGSALLASSVPAVTAIVMFLVIVGFVAAMIWFMVRMSLFSIQTFDEKRFNLFGTWKLTNGNFWSLLAGYFIAFIMAILVMLLFVLIFFGIATAIGQNPLEFLGRMMATDGPMPTNELYSDPLMLGYMAASALILTPLTTAIMTGAPAAAYKSLKAYQSVHTA